MLAASYYYYYCRCCRLPVPAQTTCKPSITKDLETACCMSVAFVSAAAVKAGGPANLASFWHLRVASQGNLAAISDEAPVRGRFAAGDKPPSELLLWLNWLPGHLLASQLRSSSLLAVEFSREAVRATLRLPI
mmetsp:Transcript_38651/g.62365  ORF Transcript_38651/g.62365 Transcript_38651/m.62365 type:complete len:133 (-) Transcript_38651:89-487(-)